ncbi:serine dehydratase beta chain [Streptomyces sp. NPDC001584]|uniref:serine dehydratase beta chain n=1 Tax=Streptomyces sp. NPDC001584 TaxID=3154521 RepID=UPI00331ACEF0
MPPLSGQNPSDRSARRATASGSGSGKAVLLGLEGDGPETVDTGTRDDRVRRIHEAGRLRLLRRREVEFREREDLVLHRRRTLPFHPNGVQFPARDREGGTLRARTYYSVGGGFVVDESTPGRRPHQARRHTCTAPLRLGIRTAVPRQRDRPADQWGDAHQGADPAERERGARRPAADVGGDAGVRGARLFTDRDHPARAA